MKMYLKNIMLTTILLLIYSCIEEIDIKDEVEFESILIIEATITNENKKQEIFLSRTFKLEEDEPTKEVEANVKITDGNANVIEFVETAAGVYKSITEFSPQTNTNYQLEIKTSDGREYGSSIMQLTPITPINDVYVERNFNENGEEGVSIFVETQNTVDVPSYYRYEYEETYKIIAPLYSPFELEILNNDFHYEQELLFQYPGIEALLDFFFELRLREEQEQICYNTRKSTDILISSTEELMNIDTNLFRVRFLGRDNSEIMHRYSILVRQYNQSREANTFYKTLNEFSSSENVFSQVQAGFLEGNVFSKTNQDEKVIGFFEVTSYDEQRVYFNYDDLFAGEPRPPYYISCDDTLTPIFLEEDFFHNITNSPVIDALTTNNFPQIYYASTDDESPSPFANRPFELVLRPCGDCTVYGDNSIPDFWIEE